ncbi:MAG: hypothetical protein GIX03_14955 [Candidatus Eremiobacteraeota bacterium]|nr:hypothetical protein [Candidatus Eremiobacteraeota bacterium]MBC5823929.1 hypothetical protein [Candidatus Eremiobacteraeota bacterium]
MNRKRFRVLALATFTLILASSTAWQAEGRGRNAPYPSMAPINQYLIPNRDAEAALARSAAPEAISRYATVLVLGRHGYKTVAEGKNGFTCLVERSWMSPFDSPEFWNSKIRGPICYNPAASRSILLYTFKRTDLVLSGLSKAKMIDRINAAFAGKELPTPEPGAMSYMMSREGYLGDSVGHWLPHLMFHVPKADGARDGASWGADMRDSPVILNTSYRRMPEPETIFMVPAGNWSDGTAASPMSLK